jgi:uncharacterized membrane protein YedE/YeeE
MSNFTPISSTIGGALIGLSATIMLTLNGRIAGCSGILGGTLLPKKGDVAWRALFLAGLILGGGLFALFRPATFGESPRPMAVVLVAGLLVGVGVRLSNGCTSGHGMCGLSRFSRRSAVATMTFMALAAATTFVYEHVLRGAS